MLNALDARFEVHAVERIGHDPRYPATDGWPHLLEELLEAIDLHRAPVVLLGHSLGGVLSIAAARARPESIKAVVILDSPVLSGWRAAVFKLLKLTGFDDRFSPARATAKRRVDFDTLESALMHFKSKPVFRHFDEEALSDYLGRPQPGVPLRLAFDAAIEAQIYRTIPHRLMGEKPDGGDVPMGFLAGCSSYETRLVGLSEIYRLVGPELHWVHGSHLFPMERPYACAGMANAMFERLLRRSAAP
jgi:pimeloyl-ACP methyl ester carboxylesterase